MWHRLGTPAEIGELLGISENEHIYRAKANLYGNSKMDPTSKIALEDLLHFEQTTFLHGLLLVEDKLSMSNSLEVRIPFLDEDLVNFANQLPNSMRFNNQTHNLRDLKTSDNLFQKEQLKQSGKTSLRNISKHYLPHTSKLSKQGFSAPDSNWFRNESKHFIRRRLSNRENLLWELLDFDSSQGLINSHMSGRANRRLLIWSLLTLESTIRQFGFKA